MIPNNLQERANIGNLTENVRMGIDETAFAHIMNILTDLYSDPALAVIREYSTNARDAMVEAGNGDKPIVVTLPLPGAVSPSFKVQDFGVGLTLEEIREVYSQYGASTKRASNDVNGMLGLGCKSGLTFAASFTITAVKDGQRSIAVVTKDDDGVGAIKVLTVSATTEANGVTIEIPVPKHKVNAFNQTAIDFYRFWEPGTVQVVHTGQMSVPVPDFWRETKDSADAVWITPDILVTRNESYNEKSRVIMGNVAYPHDFGISGVIIKAWVPIGAVNFAPSREALHYTESTNNVIKNIEATVRGKLAARIQEVAKNGTPFEQNNVLYKWSEKVSALKGTRKVVQSDPITTFKVTGDTARKAKHAITHWQDFNNTSFHLVSGYPFRSVGVSHKRRLSEKFGKYPNVILYPEGTDLSAIEGHPRLVTWDHIVKTTKKPTTTQNGGKRPKTTYTYRLGDKMVTSEQFVAVPVYYTTGAYDPRFPEIRQVVLSHRKPVWERFCRLHPKAITVEQYAEEQRRKAVLQLTTDDKLAIAIQRGYLSGPFRDKNFQKQAHRLEDPLLKRVTGLVTYQSPTLSRADTLGVTVPNETDLTAQILKDYPLLAQFRNARVTNSNYQYTDITEDLIIYANAKYKANLARKQGN